MKVVYPVIFTETKDKKDLVLIYIPDLDRSSEGYGVNDAFYMAKDCIGLMLYDLKDDELPKASKIEDIDISKGIFVKDGKSFVSLVDVDLDLYRIQEKSRTVRRNITLPKWLDDMATKAKINVSAVAQNGLKAELGIAI